jgi:hypothetical protein
MSRNKKTYHKIKMIKFRAKTIKHNFKLISLKKIPTEIKLIK